MSDSTEIKLVGGRANRGKFPISLMRGNDVLLAGKVNPHEPEQVEAFIERACAQLPGLRDRKDELRRELLNLAKPKELSAPRAPRSADDHPYSECMGGIYWHRVLGDNEILVPLTNFTGRIVSDVMRDDGTESEAAFEIAATLRGSAYRLTLPASRFNSMSWPAEHLGAEAIVYPGQSVRDHARAAIQFLSPRPIPRRTIFTHTGWRKLDSGASKNGEWVYLHGGGAIGSSGTVKGVQVDLTGALTPYELPDPPQGTELQGAIRASLRMLDLSPDSIVFVTFCAIWRAVLGPCDFGLHLAGPSGVFKSELAALAQQHFGPGLDARHLPGSWSSTDNALEGILFAAKDTLTTVDDFAPCGGAHDVARWHQRADRIFRAQGNNAGRGRMRADGTLRPPKPPRGLVLSTGEDIPKGQSLRARVLILEISKGDIARDVLTCCQQDARSGAYAAALAGFVRYLAQRYQQLRDGLRSEVELLRDRATCDSHNRTPEIMANLALGLRHFINYAQDAGAITAAEGDLLSKRGWTALALAGETQADHQAANEPAGRFIELLTSALASGHAHLADRDGNAPTNPAAFGWREQTGGAYPRDEWHPLGDRIGWIDGEDVLLEPDASYRAAQNMAGGNGDGLVVTARTLRKRLDEKGMMIRQTADELLSRRVLEGRMRNVLHLARGILCIQPRESLISPDEPISNHENGEESGISHPANLLTPSKTPHGTPACPHPDGPFAGNAGNAGNAGKHVGDIAPGNLAHIGLAGCRQRGRI